MAIDSAAPSASSAPHTAAHAGNGARPGFNAGSVPGAERAPFSVELVFDQITLTLRQAPAPVPPERRPTSHYSGAQAGVDVRCQSEDDRPRLLHLSARSNAPGWNPHWVRWSYAARQTPTDQGGDALAAQDAPGDDGRTLALLLLPGERREATLEIRAALDGETQPGDYDFEVVLTDAEAGEEAAASGLARLRHPASGLLQSLPALYTPSQAAPAHPLAPYEGPSFFERFLRGFEDAGEPLDELLTGLHRHFDADTAPADFLPWLATWVALDLDPNWLQLRRRRLIKEAIWLYRWRGTRPGLSRFIELYCGFRPEINDQPFSGMKLGPGTLLGRDTVLGGVRPHTFLVTLAVPDPAALSAETIRLIIESQKPAHTAYELRIVGREAGAEAL